MSRNAAKDHSLERVVSQLVPMFLAMPVFSSVRLGLLLLGVITAVGLIAILQRHG